MEVMKKFDDVAVDVQLEEENELAVVVEVSCEEELAAYDHEDNLEPMNNFLRLQIDQVNLFLCLRVG